MNIKTRLLNNNGSALLTVLLVVLISTILVASFFVMSSQRSFMANKLTNRTRALSIAEAGIHVAYSILETNFEASANDNAFPATGYGGGQFDVTVTQISNNVAVIKSEGTFGEVTETVILDVTKYGATSPGSGGTSNPVPQGAWACAILSGDDMTWSGSGMTDVGTGKIHTNGKDKHTGSCKITGNLSSCVRIWCTGSTQIYGDTAAPLYKGASPGNIHGTAYKGHVAPIAIPDLDLTPYYNWALAHGEVYNGNKKITKGEVKPNGGIMWVNGKLRMSTSDNMIGCFIATGDLDITGSGDQIKVGDFPAVISRDGDIDISGSGKFHGLMYAKNGDFDKTGSGDVVGSIICAGEFDKAGSWEDMAYEYSEPTPPGGGAPPVPPSGGYELRPTAWQK
jgi:hypothetical protein